jgi:hypothetical protein
MQHIPPFTRALVVLSLWTLGSADLHAQRVAPKKIDLPAGELTMPLSWFMKKPVVDLKINGKGPYRFYLDTGAGGSVLDQDLADELKLPVVGKARVGSPGGKGLPATAVRLDRVELGSANLSALPALAHQGTHVDAGPETPRGVLSAAVFPGYLVTIDYPKSRLVIRPGALPDADGVHVLGYGAGRPLPEVTLSVAGQQITVHLDSGAPGGITLPLQWAKRLPLAAKPVEVGRGKRVDQEVVILGAKLNGQVKIGGIVLENPDLRFQNIPKAPGHIGYEVLRHFAVTLDTKNRRIQLVAQVEAQH